METIASKALPLMALATIAMLGAVPSIAMAQETVRHRGSGDDLTESDRAAFLDARLAALKAVLRLTPDQERLWPGVEAALRDAAKARSERLAQLRQMRREWREGGDGTTRPFDPLARMRERAERLTASAALWRKIADAAEPLYSSLDEGQKRRLAVIMRAGSRPGLAERRPPWRGRE